MSLLLCLGSLPCRITQVHLAFRAWTDGWIFSLRIFWLRAELMVPSIMPSCPGPEAPDHHATTMFDSWYDVILMICISFTPDVMWPKFLEKFSLSACQSTEYFLKYFGDDQNVRQTFVLFGQQWFYSWNSPMDFSPSLFLIVHESRTLTNTFLNFLWPQ